MKRSLVKSVARMMLTFAGSYIGAKSVGWIFDNVIDRS
jgi:hypothetical protein